MTAPGSPSLRRVFVDSGAYYALADPHDSHHEAAVAIVNQLPHSPARLFTTNFILAESHALVLNRRGRPAAMRLLVEFDQGSTTIVRVSAADERRARAIIDQYTDKNFSYTDATSFAVMERLGITHAFTFDRNFTQYGLTALASV